MQSKKDGTAIRLRDAALMLFADQGYERTSAAQIAAAAGVTERTFFRYFPDKREVLFDREQVVRDSLLASIATAPADLAPLATLRRAFEAFETMLVANRDYAAAREIVIAATPALQEREFAKTAALIDALAGALRARGVGALPATLAAHVGMAAFVQATREWLKDQAIRFSAQLDEAFDALAQLHNS